MHDAEYQRIYTADYRGEKVEPMPFDWNSFANFIAKLALIALRWYQVVEGNGDTRLETTRRQRVARVIDPGNPDLTVEEAELSEAEIFK